MSGLDLPLGELERRARLFEDDTKEKRLAKHVIERLMNIAADYADKYHTEMTKPRSEPKPDAKPKLNKKGVPIKHRETGEVVDPEVLFKEWALLAVAWAKELAPYQSPTMKAVIVAPQRQPTTADSITEIRTLTEMRQYLVQRNVPVEQFGKLLMGPTKVIDHDDPEEIKKVYGETTSS